MNLLVGGCFASVFAVIHVNPMKNMQANKVPLYSTGGYE